ncbi:hypothetical protein GQ55_4G344300 [Panicum hallii var. hallii]|uniref:Uncharacterized protein n=1 Tax=Panicum hallii var. hallii TaxID=1504633 RepID=A0A2T7E355_9POAL|nr:hypothetical protein GQ55_4G344300 [Panicum hallii var. hallii]
MRKTKRGSDATRGLRKNRKARKTMSVVSGHLYGDPNEDVWTGLSDEQKSYLSKSVTSITLCNGDTTLFSCSGIAIDRQGIHLTRFLTSASLVTALNDIGDKNHLIDIEIEVRHEGNLVYEGVLAEFDLNHNFAVIEVYAFVDVHVGPRHVLEIPSHGDVLLVALGHGVSGQLITRTVMLSGDLRVSEDEDRACKISEAWEGGPLFSFDGNFVGMNLFLTTRRAFFLPWNIIFEHLKQQVTLSQLKCLKFYRFGAGPIGEKSSSHLEVHGGLNQEQLELDSMGYPKLPSTMLGAGMILVNTFEETFSDIYGEGVWRKVGKKASSNINRSVVALASFNGEKKVFCMHRFFVEWNGATVILTSASLVRSSGDENNIVENLRIEVLLPHNQCREGKLQNYCLHYNIALVSIMDYHARRPANVLVDWPSVDKVAAVGRCFESGALMAMTGILVPWSGTLDCEFLIRSSCKITKAGIGGPVVTLDGDVIGMNFYDKRIGTPFLPWECISDILEWSDGKSKPGKIGNDGDSFDAPFCKMTESDKDRLNRLWSLP